MMKPKSVLLIFFMLAMMSAMPCRVMAGAADELRKAKYEERNSSASSAFETAMEGLRKFPQDKNLFLYALELADEATQSQLSFLENKARNMSVRSPKDFVWHLGVCSLKRRQSQPEDALQSCLKAVQYGKNEYSVNVETAKTYLAIGVYDRADEFASNARAINPSDFEALYTAGMVYEAQNLYAKAKKTYTAALSAAENDLSTRSDDNKTRASNAIKRATLSQKRQQSRAAAKKARENIGAAAEACTKKFNELADKEDFTAAAQIGKDCMRKNKRNYALSARLADVLVNAGEYEEAVTEYARAQRLAGEDHVAYAKLCIKEAETLIRLEDRTEAEKRYRMAAASAPFDDGILLAVANYFYGQNAFKDALHYYSLLLQISPKNRTAMERAEGIRLDMMSDEEILEELRQRKAISDRVTQITETELRLHRNIRSAEAAGAVEIVRQKFPEKRNQFLYEDDENGIKIKLTKAGYDAYARLISYEAVKFFEKRKINLRETFKLRDVSGSPMFEKNGFLTSEGFNAYLEAKRTGRVTWIFSYQPIPGSKKQIQSSREIAQLSNQGYREISEPEYLWLLKATDCPPDVMTGPLIKLKEVNDGAVNHYLICYQIPGKCATTANAGLPGMIEQYRNGEKEIPEGYSTSFFGTGGVKRHKLCENGEVYGL